MSQFSSTRRRSRRVVAALAGIKLAVGTSAVGLAAPASAPPAQAAAAAPDAAAPSDLIGHWAFDEGAGTTAADSAGSHPATLSGGTGWAPGIKGRSALTTNGNGAVADTGAAVLNTASSFTVSTWVKLNNLNGFQTVVSQDGGTVSSFFLGLRGDTGKFAFVRLPDDSGSSPAAFPSALAAPVAGQWYQVTGVYDSSASTLSLYVNGQLQQSTAAPTGWAAAGDLVIGRGKYGGNPVDFVNGTIDDVRAYSGALSPSAVNLLAQNGSWRFDEGSGST